MSDEMALGDNASGEESKVNGEEAAAASAVDAATAAAEPPAEPGPSPAVDTPASAEGIMRTFT